MKGWENKGSDLIKEYRERNARVSFAVLFLFGEEQAQRKGAFGLLVV